ncbi:MAG TPA: iron ABC transporter permease [Mesotoga infera]|nr:iron ABC transporter permease [Mesotoga sp.]NLI06961.1 iron ABC transporter permease [Thermotogaceae bacterium]HOI34836.1 iron ABC transporter permease [Mesotoga infera]HON28307.1 iron ABC transporter permease [Mesotoga infera]HPD37976.1 iron ABC transporter permease [Mesotoga infera]
MIALYSWKKLLNFLVLSVAVFVALFWIFDTLKQSFYKITRDNQKRLVTVLSGAAPREAGLAESWIVAANKEFTDADIIYVDGIPGWSELTVLAPDPELKSFFDEYSGSADFKKGFESVYYLENYYSDLEYSFDRQRVSLVFSPLIDETGYDITGFLVFLLSAEGGKNYARLLDIFMIGAFAVFVIIYFISKFFRDPAMGYIILGLFIMVGIFVAYPLFEAVRLTFLMDGSFSMNTWVSILTSRQYLSALWGSVKLGMLTATFSTLIGFIFAFVINRTAIKGKRFLGTMGLLPVISPPFSLSLSLILLFGSNGLITKQILGLKDFTIYGLGGLTAVQTIGMFPIAFLTMSGVLQAIDSTLEEASLDLNGSRWKTFSRITFPLAIPGVLSSWLLVFTNSLADFANPLLLAGSYRVLSVEAYIEVTGRNRLGHGAALSILLLLPSVTAFLVQRYWVSRKSYVTVTGKPSARLSDLVSRPVKYLLVAFISLFIVFILGLYGTIVAGCFVANWGIDYSFTLKNITEALQRGRDAILDTFTLSAIATPIAGLIAMMVALVIVRKKFAGKRVLEGLILAPFAIPGTLIGIAYILAFDEPPLILIGTGAIIVINYIIRELPVGVEGGVATLRQIDPAIEEAAQDLGADSTTVFRTIVLPLIRPAFISGMSYTFVRSMTAVSAIIFLISAQWYHMTVLIYNFSESIRFGLASVLSTVLIIIVFATFGLMRLLVRKNEYLEKSVNLN